jgi:hypothetical protein
MMDFGWLNNFGIVMEIAGFVMILIAIRSTDVRTFDIGPDKVMSTRHPWLNRTGIFMVIIGLVGQLTSNTVPHWRYIFW